MYDAEGNAEIYSRIMRANSARAPNITVRMFWEPNFQPPPVGRWVQYLPWEFEVVPSAWVDILNEHTDEVRPMAN